MLACYTRASNRSDKPGCSRIAAEAHAKQTKMKQIGKGETHAILRLAKGFR